MRDTGLECYTFSTPFGYILHNVESISKGLESVSQIVSTFMGYPATRMFLKLNNVPRKGLEPSWVAPLAPKASASTNFATWAHYLFSKEQFLAHQEPDRMQSSFLFVHSARASTNFATRA